MKIKVGNKVYKGEDAPIMVILTDRDKELIANMGDSKNYCVYPSDEKWEKDNYAKIMAWMADI